VYYRICILLYILDIHIHTTYGMPTRIYCLCYIIFRYIRTIFQQLLDHKSHPPLLFSSQRSPPQARQKSCGVMSSRRSILRWYTDIHGYSLCDATTTYTPFPFHGSDAENRISVVT
jgi:hypothetical protein